LLTHLPVGVQETIVYLNHSIVYWCRCPLRSTRLTGSRNCPVWSAGRCSPRCADVGRETRFEAALRRPMCCSVGCWSISYPGRAVFVVQHQMQVSRGEYTPTDLHTFFLFGPERRVPKSHCSSCCCCYCCYQFSKNP